MQLRVWWIPQVGMDNRFEVEVQSIKEAAKVLDTLANYDIFQLENKIKPDFSNMGGLEQYNDLNGEWEDWTLDLDAEIEGEWYCSYIDDASEFVDFLQDNDLDEVQVLNAVEGVTKE